MGFLFFCLVGRVFLMIASFYIASREVITRAVSRKDWCLVPASHAPVIQGVVPPAVHLLDVSTQAQAFCGPDERIIKD